ncbi:MAG TPA: DUF4870 domain-containing protein [Patescibacteria group bacterium]|nr:DUF4870 domain-containing protein [Patescibacteria group bacterium]
MAANPTGLGKNEEAALSYIIPLLGGIAFLMIEKDKYVRFHAMQSIVFWVATTLIWMVLGFTIILLFFAPIFFIAAFILWLVLVYKAWQGEEWEIPVLGKFARQFLSKVNN